MKKLIALTFAMLFLGAGIASATDFTLTGSYYARGTYIENWDGTGTDQNDYGQYDHELSLDANWQIDDTTKVFARFEIRDETWGDATNPTEGTHLNDDISADLDDNIVVEQVYGQHSFGNGATVRVGLMGANAWATDFGDNGGEEYRVWSSFETSFGMIFGIIGKGAGGDETGDAGNDTDSYALAMITKLGAVNVKPLLKYVDAESSDLEIFAAVLGLDGTAGMIGWEVEGVYKDYDYDTGTDFDIYGLYGNVWAQIDAVKLGALVAYGSYDETTGAGFGFGDNFTAGGALILGDDMFTNGSGIDVNAATLLAAYLSYAATDKLTLGAYFGYADSNVDDATSDWDGANAWEVSVSGAYKITDNVTYSVAAGTAQINYGPSAGADPDKAIEIFHRLAFSF